MVSIDSSIESNDKQYPMVVVLLVFPINTKNENLWRQNIFSLSHVSILKLCPAVVAIFGFQPS